MPNLKILLNTRRHLIESVALFLVAGLILIFATIPQIRTSLSINDQVEKEKPKVAKLESKLANLENVLVTSEFAQSQLVNLALPSKKPLIELLISLQSSALQSQAEIINFEVSPGSLATESAQIKTTSRNSQGSDYLEMEVSLSGTFASIQQFLKYTEQFTPFTIISRISIDVPEEDLESITTSPDETTADLTIRTYYFTKVVESSVDSILPTMTDANRSVLNQLADYQHIIVPQQQQIEGGGNLEIFGDVKKYFEN